MKTDKTEIVETTIKAPTLGAENVTSETKIPEIQSDKPTDKKVGFAEVVPVNYNIGVNPWVVLSADEKSRTEALVIDKVGTVVKTSLINDDKSFYNQSLVFIHGVRTAPSDKGGNKLVAALNWN